MKLALASVNQAEQAALPQVICPSQYGEKSNRATWWRVNFSLWLYWGDGLQSSHRDLYRSISQSSALDTVGSQPLYQIS